jgi:predicted ABC-type ATPase
MKSGKRPPVSRLRMFAGPNGSGKTTISNIVEKENEIWLGIKVNPDDIQADIKAHRVFDFGPFEIQVRENELREFFDSSAHRLREAGSLRKAQKLRVRNNRVSFRNVPVNSLLAQLLAEFIRERLLPTGKSFSFETVMSHPSKAQFLSRAHEAGYKNYLYFVTTKDPVINAARVKARVEAGGHPVPRGRIATRYARAMENLLDAIKLSDRAYVYDNSGEEVVLIAEFNAGILTLHVDEVPQWFDKYVLKKLKK